jgi:AMP deaminase
MAELDKNAHTTVEWRISIYGRKPTEWKALAQWFYTHRLAHRNVRWLIQVPRIYHVYRAAQQVQTFGELLRNVFEPIFANTLDPNSDPALFYFLEAVVGFDSVDDESVPEQQLLSTELPPPQEYNAAHNPPYAYWMYYMYANLATLNQLRASRGLKTFAFRPHAGEAGDPDHLLSTFLLAQGINHGLLLYRSPALHYLHYLAQVGIAMSPLCNSQLFVKCHKNPFPRYFRQGMNMSLSTDTPLLTHHLDDGLAEEYTVCAQMWKLSSTDLCEIARASVLQSGLERSLKQLYLGSDYQDMQRTNVPSIRLAYRSELLQAELASLECVE